MIRDKGLQPERTAMSWLRTQLVLFGTSLLLSRTYFVHHNKLLALTTLFCIILAFIFSIYIQRRFEKGFTNLNAISSLEYKAKVLLSITVALLAFCYALFNFFRLWWKF
ncbi:DUF202 domain-containing protein [Photobacterium leiognathi]|uniref:DUF202 domain-containing protein n=1 Tax=Photobacterium leiognathi TaxID=553611 RepID=UPI000D171EEF|nr:hypothetical protein C0W40_13710 [Photobacterium leiognathi subsp. mandapamensis]